MILRRFLTLLFLSICIPSIALAQPDSNANKLSERIQLLKKNVLNINSELRILEQQLLYPSSQTAIFLSVDVGTPIRLVDINVSLDGKHVAYHFYTRQEFDALSKGGIQRLYNGNVGSGRHTLKVKITGYDPQGQNYKKNASFSFTKGPGRKYIELHLKDNLNTMKPSIELREWNK